MATLAEIRAKLLAQESKGNKSWSDNNIYPFWNIPEDKTSTIRFLPDKDESNTYFWRERQMIKIPFSGIAGVDEHKAVIVQVPCVEMWGETCPVHAEIRPWFKDPALEDLARKYWKKRSYLFQGFVTENSLPDDETPENPIRRFQINPSIFNIIKGALMDPDFVEIPTDYEQGTDFKLTKTQKGQYADYSTSNWARRERSLSEEEREAIATHGLYDLNDFMPKKPGDAELNAIVEMFEASVDGQLYDPDRWAKFYRPPGVSSPTGSTPKAESAAPGVSSPTGSTPKAESAAPVATTAPTAESTPVVDQKDESDKIDFDAPSTDAPDTKKASANDILAAIRNRK